jgi:hypothetical protein
VSRYEKLGARHYGLELGRGDIYGLVPWKSAPTGSLPVFRFFKETQRDGELPKLPPVAVRFGISLAWTGIADSGIKHLAALDTLIYLDLFGTHVTDKG